MSEITQLINLLKEQHAADMEQQKELQKQQQAQYEEQLKLLQEKQQELIDKLLQKPAVGGSTPVTVHSTASVPSFTAFDPTTELWEDYYARFCTFLGAHSVDTGKHAQIFLTNQSSTVYQLLVNLASQMATPKDINTLSMDEIETFMKQQYDPKRFVVRERYKFWSDMKRKPGETIQELAARIRKDAATCDFKKITDPLDEALRTRFICSVGNEAILKALFKIDDNDLDFSKAIEVATEVEEAAKVAKETVHGSTVSVQRVKQRKPHPVQPNSKSSAKGPCFRCGKSNHMAKECKSKHLECNFCHKNGHIEAVCFKKERQSTHTRPVKNITLHAVNIPEDYAPKLEVPININGVSCVMEMDTATTGNFISQQQWEALGKPSLAVPEWRYESASKHDLPVKGTFKADAQVPGRSDHHEILFTVTDVPELNLLGRQAIKQMGISLDEMLQDTEQCNAVFSHLQTDEALKKKCQQLCDDFPNLWKDELGCLKDVELEVKFKKQTQPVFCKPRQVPYGLQEELERQYKQGIERGIWEPTQFNEYGTPVVPVRKESVLGSTKAKPLRVCGDYSVTVNDQLQDHRHPIPLPEDLMRQLGGGYGFTKIDLADAYNQIKLGPISQKRLALSTHQGVLLQKRLCFGIKSAPGYFQQLMDQLTKDLPGVAVYLDDILVSGKDAEDHVNNLKRLLQRLDDKGLRCRLHKCQFAQPYIEYLGHLLSKEGVAKGPKVDDVIKMPPPQDVTSLKSFLGSVQFYAKFLPSNYSTIAEPLYSLTKKTTQWTWGPGQQAAFDSLKNLLSSENVLVHYDEKIPIGIACDASSVGIGAVLFHRYPDGSERPICNVSKKLTDSQRNYSQIQKEALAIVFGLKKFYQYIYGRQFTIVTDHRPLIAMFGPGKGTPALAANRLSRWALMLSQFNYKIEYRRTSDHANADVLSRLPASHDTHFDGEESQDDAEMVCAVHSVSRRVNPGDQNALRHESAKDPIISMVLKFTREGWPPKKDDEGSDMKRFRQLADSLAIVNGCLVHGSRAVIPVSLRRKVLQELHLGHFGMQRMKQLARTAVYWPNIDNDIENMCRGCSTCGEHQNKPAKPAVHPWMLPEKPWSRIHLDHAVNFMGSNWLILIDAYSKFPCIHQTQSLSTKATIDLLRQDFALFGYPHTLVTDNATTFMSDEFQQWCKDKGISHLTGAPYHPATNGAAERLVQTFKRSLQKSSLPLKEAVQEFLMQYRRTPNSSGYSPSELLNNRQIRTTIDTLIPSPAHAAQSKQMKDAAQSQARAVNKQELVYKVGDAVYALYHGPRRDKDPRWVPAVVTKRMGTRTVNVRVYPRGPTWRRHWEQLRPRQTNPDDDDPGDAVKLAKPGDTPDTDPTDDHTTSGEQSDTKQKSVPETRLPTRRSTRSTRGKPPNRFSP